MKIALLTSASQLVGQVELRTQPLPLHVRLGDRIFERMLASMKGAPVYREIEPVTVDELPENSQKVR